MMIDWAQATQVKEGRMTSEPFGRSSRIHAIYNALDPLSTIAKFGIEKYAENFFSNSSTFFPKPIHWLSMQALTFSISSLPTRDPKTDIIFLFKVKQLN